MSEKLVLLEENKLLCEFAGVFYRPSSSLAFAVVKAMIFISLCMTQIVFLMMYLTSCYKGNENCELSEKVLAVEIIIWLVLAIVGLIMMPAASSKLNMILEELGDFRGIYEKPKNMERVNKVFEEVSKLLLPLYKTTCLLATLIVLFFVDCPGNGAICSVLLRSSSFKTTNFYGKKALLLLELFNYLIRELIPVATILQFTGVCELFIVRIRHLKCMVEEIPNLNFRNSEFQKVHFRKCVVHHQKINKIWKQYVTIVSNLLVFPALLCFTQGGLMTWCLYYKFDLVLTLDMCSTFAITVLVSVLGQRLINSSLELTVAIWNSIPVGGDVGLQKDMLLMLLRCQHPLKMDVGKFSSLSLPFLVSYIKMVYTILSFMMNTLN